MKILHLVSDQSFTLSVIEYTKELAKLTRSSVTLLYIASRSKDLEVGWATLSQAQKSFEDMAVKVKLEQGDVIDNFLAEIEQEEYDMVVLEARRRRGLLPSNLRLKLKILDHSPIPVLMVRHANVKLERVLICTGGLEISQPVIKLSAALAGSAHLDAALLYVSGSPPSMFAGTEVTDDSLEKIMMGDTPLAQHLKHSAAQLEEAGIRSRTVIRHGIVAESILEEAQSGKYDLIVMGASKSKKDLSGFLLGDVTREVIEQAQSAVLIVKQGMS